MKIVDDKVVAESLAHLREAIRNCDESDLLRLEVELRRLVAVARSCVYENYPDDGWGRANKIGMQAERSAMRHFEELGYRVDRTGIESILSPEALEAWRRNDSRYLGDSIRGFMQRLPDLFVYRATRRKYREAFFVEVKSRRTLYLTNDETSCSSCEHRHSSHLYKDEKIECSTGNGDGGYYCLACKYSKLLQLSSQSSAQPTSSSMRILFYVKSDYLRLKKRKTRAIYDKGHLAIQWSDTSTWSVVGKQKSGNDRSTPGWQKNLSPDGETFDAIGVRLFAMNTTAT